MTIPVTLNTISNLQDTTTAQTNINANSASIVGGFSTALNVTGDQMKGNLDMNSNQILNLPSPATAHSPVRLVDVTSSSSIASVPPVGTSGAVVPLLNTNNTWSGTNSFGAISASTISGNITFSGNETFSGNNTFSGSSVFSGAVSLPVTTARIKSSSAVTLYVNGTTGSDSNTGASATSAFSTISAGVNYLYANYDLAGVGANVNVAAGTYNEQVTIEGLDRGALVDLNLNGASSVNTIINSPSGSCIALKDYGVVDINGFTLTGSSTAVAAISCGQFAICDFGNDMVLGTFPLNGSAHFSISQNASVNVLSNYKISGAASYHFLVQTGALLSTNTITASMPSALSFNTFGYFYQGAVANVGGYSVSGSGVVGTTGIRFYKGPAAFIGSAGLDLNTMFPGDASGVYYTSNHYDYLTPTNTVTTLANISANVGNIAVVTDATVTTPNTSVTGGGSLTVMVWYNNATGTWRILGS